MKRTTTTTPGKSAGRVMPEASTLRRPFELQGLIELLYEKARPALSRADLVAIAEGAAGHAESVARNAVIVAEGVACLVACDTGKGEFGAVGSFQSTRDVPGLLFHFADVFQQVEAVAGVAASAVAALTEGGAA